MVNEADLREPSPGIVSSSIKHELKFKGDIPFINYVEKENPVRENLRIKYYYTAIYYMALYLYLCRIHNHKPHPNIEKYAVIKLPVPIFQPDVYLLDFMNKNDEIKRQVTEESIPEFRERNIMETEVRDVV